MKVRIVPGDFGRYLSNGGSFDENLPDPLSFEIELAARPMKDEAILVLQDEGLVVGQVQEIVTSDSQVYVFVPLFRPVGS